jgi:RimJ/RimL family protein N-acetyltransferase
MADPPRASAKPHESVIVRPLRWSDFEPLVRIYYDLYEERSEGVPIGIHLFHERPSPADEAEWFSGLFRRVLKEEDVVVVAEVEGRPVGQCTIGPVGPTRHSETGHVGILGILVDRQYRGQGIGTALLKRSLEECRGKFELVRLSVFADNDGAKRLYARLGFRPCGTLPRAIKRGNQYIDEDLMFLDLADRAARPGPGRR